MCEWPIPTSTLLAWPPSYASARSRWRRSGPTTRPREATAAPLPTRPHPNPLPEGEGGWTLAVPRRLCEYRPPTSLSLRERAGVRASANRSARRSAAQSTMHWNAFDMRGSRKGSGAETGAQEPKRVPRSRNGCPLPEGAGECASASPPHLRGPAPFPPLPPGEASGSGDCPRAGRGEGVSESSGPWVRNDGRGSIHRIDPPWPSRPSTAFR
jgi:hypothetical protein